MQARNTPLQLAEKDLLFGFDVLMPDRNDSDEDGDGEHVVHDDQCSHEDRKREDDGDRANHVGEERQSCGKACDEHGPGGTIESGLGRFDFRNH